MSRLVLVSSLRDALMNSRHIVQMRDHSWDVADALEAVTNRFRPLVDDLEADGYEFFLERNEVHGRRTTAGCTWPDCARHP